MWRKVCSETERNNGGEKDCEKVDEDRVKGGERKKRGSARESEGRTAGSYGEDY